VPTGEVLPAPSEEMAQIGARLERLARSSVDSATLRHLALSLEEMSAAYERNGGAAVYRLVRHERHWIEHLLEEQQRPRDRIELHAAGGKLSAVLGYLAFDLGHRTLADAFLTEAFSVAEAATDRDLMAWVRGLQSFVAYYAGRYHDALDLARDGQRYAGGGPQSIRLAVAGEARALGRLGDTYGVTEAVERALGARERLPGGQPVGEFLSMQPLGLGRIHGNAPAPTSPSGTPPASRSTPSGRWRCSPGTRRPPARRSPPSTSPSPTRAGAAPTRTRQRRRSDEPLTPVPTCSPTWWPPACTTS